MLVEVGDWGLGLTYLFMRSCGEKSVMCIVPEFDGQAQSRHSGSQENKKKSNRLTSKFASLDS